MPDLISGEPDLILTNAKVVTVDKSFSRQEAAAIKGGRFVSVGTRKNVEKLKGEKTHVMDLKGKTVIPGLIDSHNHPASMGKVLGDVDLYEVKSIADIISRLTERAARSAPGQAVVGRAACLDEDVLDEGRLPRAGDLDRVAGDRPVIVTDVNKTIVNGMVLKSIAVTRETADPERGYIERDRRTGEPTGVFFFAAKGLTPIRGQSGSGENIPLEEALRRVQQAYVQVGLTSVVDGSVGPELLQAYRAFNRRGELRLRVTLMPWVALLKEPEKMEEMGLKFGVREGMITIGPLKIFFDPFIMHKTALLYRPYEGEPDNCGYTTMELAELRGLLESAAERKWPVGIHTTGDKGIDLVVNALAEALSRGNGLPGPSHVIHVYLPTEKALARLRELKIGVAVQPPFTSCWGETLRKYVGPERSAYFTPLAKFSSYGIVIGGGSDAPVVHFNPFLGLHAAVARKTAAGRCLGKEERLSREQALHLYTLGSASITGEEESKGSIETGKFADLVVLDRDFLTIPEDEIRDIRVETTMINGEIVYERS